MNKSFRRPAFFFLFCMLLCGSFFYSSFSEANQSTQKLEQTSSKQSSFKALKTVFCGQWKEESSTKFITLVLTLFFVARSFEPIASFYLNKSKKIVSNSFQIIKYIQKKDGKKRM